MGGEDARVGQGECVGAGRAPGLGYGCARESGLAFRQRGNNSQPFGPSINDRTTAGPQAQSSLCELAATADRRRACSWLSLLTWVAETWFWGATIWRVYAECCL